MILVFGLRSNPMNESIFDLHGELESTHWWFRGRRRIVTDLVGALLVGTKGSVVDVGCGTGGIAGHLSDTFPCVGIDPSEQAIHIARARWPKARFIAGSIAVEGLEIGPAPRVFLLLDVLEHVEDDRALLAHVLDAMAQGDQLIITVPAEMALWSEHDRSYGHFRRYDREMLAGLWADQDVAVRLMAPLNRRLYRLVWLLRRFPKRARAWGREGTDLRACPRLLNLLLEGIFGGEAKAICRWLGDRAAPDGHGVSLVAVLEKHSARVMK